MIFILGNDGIFIFGNYGNRTIMPDESARLMLRILAKPVKLVKSPCIWNLSVCKNSVQIKDTDEVSTEHIVRVSFLPHDHWVSKGYSEHNSGKKNLHRSIWNFGENKQKDPKV